MSTTSKEWHSAPDTILDKLYRVNSKKGTLDEVWLEVQHVPGVSEWAPQRGASVLVSRLRELLKAGQGVWTTWGGRGGSTKTLVRLTASSTTYEISTDEGATWRETDHPYALARRILELDPA